MLNKFLPFGVFSVMFLFLPAAAVFAEENGNGNDNGGAGFTEIIFTVLGGFVLALFIFYMIRDNAK